MKPPPWAIAIVLAAGCLLLDPRTGDLVAQEYRAAIGPVLWNNGWYSGHHVPAYSLTFPALASLIGPRLVGALSAVVATLAFGRLVGKVPGAWLAGTWLAFGMGTQLLANRLTFALGAAVGLVALAAARRAAERGGAWGGAVALAALTGLSSPVAGVFLALAAGAWWLERREGRLALFIVASVVPPALVTLLFPEGGDFPFSTSSFLPAFAGTLLVLALLPAGSLRRGVALSLLVLLVSWAITSPMGGNAVRLGTLAAGPALALALLPAGRRRALLLAAPFLLFWQLSAPVQNIAATRGDPTVRPSAYAGLTRFLAAQPGPPFRVEVAFTRNHWEAAMLPPELPLARGWERQYDRKVNALFYEDGLTAARYAAWLEENAVRFVVVADAPLDVSAEAEAALVRRGLPGLRRVYGDRVWTVWERSSARPIGPAAISVDGFRTTRAGPVRIRWSPWFQVVGGRGCVRRAPDGFTEVSGAVHVQARLGFDGLLRREEHCAA